MNALLSSVLKRCRGCKNQERILRDEEDRRGLGIGGPGRRMLFLGSHVGTTDVNEAQAQTANTSSARPNIVFILVDDMRKDDLKYMPKTKALLQSTGMTFENAFVSNALCCPSRSTIMRGQYAHNTHVWSNADSPTGGLEAYRARGYEDDNVATTLKAAGYKTALIGKYLNHYKEPTKPLGWDEWFATLDPTTYNYFNYDVSDNGTVTHFGSRDSDYVTDVLSRQTQNFIGTSVTQPEPFFAYVAPVAPHLPARLAPRHEHAYDGIYGPRLRSFEEKNVSDKPSWIRNRPRLTDAQIADIDTRHERRIESLQAVDDLVEGVVNKLKEPAPDGTVPLDNTYIFLTSDNGYFHGEHRIPMEKYRPYEEDIRVPLLVRGPGIEAGSTTGKLALNTGYLPTFAELAKTTAPTYVDGRSLRGVLDGSATTWRHAILIEGPQYNIVPPYSAIRTLDTNSQQKYVEYKGTSQREMYYLGADPRELDNKRTPPAGMAARLDALKVCKGDTCRAAENAH
jgi:N-acetylglucosamine-6-sulfatase